MKTELLIALLALCALVSVAAAAQPPQQNLIGSYSEFQNWLPLVFIAILLSITITGCYYMIGSVMNNGRIKANAANEFGQALGTGVITVILLGVFVTIGTGQLSLSQVLSPVSMSVICDQLSNSALGMINSQTVFPSGAPTPATAICTQIKLLAAGTTGADMTPRIDYGLFYSYVIIANLTNQAANNLDSFYRFVGWIGFLSEFTSFTEVCATGPACLVPVVPPQVAVKYSYKPLAGYNVITSMVSSAQLEAVLTFYIMAVQLLVITLFLAIWPYLLAGGIALHAVSFTRPLGGLLIAMSLSAVIIFPIMYAMEYTAFTNLGLGPIGASNLPTMPLYQESESGNVTVYGVKSVGAGGFVPASGVTGSGCASGQYVYENVCGYQGTKTSTCSSSPSAQTICNGTAGSNVNFFVLPKAEEVLRYYHCIPGSTPINNLITNEIAFSLLYMIPGAGLVGTMGTLVSQMPTSMLDWPLDGCKPERAIGATLALANMYGISFVAGVMMPLINLLIAWTSITGFAIIFGGKTDIEGLRKLL